MYLDLLLLILILSFALIGFVQGFVQQLISIAVLLAILFGSEALASWLQYSSSLTWAKPIPHFILWCMISFGFLVTGWLVRLSLLRVVKKGPLRATDRWVGCVLGLAKGFLVACVVSLILQVIPKSVRRDLADMDRDISNSKFISASSNIFEWELSDSLLRMRSLKRQWENLDTPHKNIESAESPWTWSSSTDSE